MKYRIFVCSSPLQLLLTSVYLKSQPKSLAERWVLVLWTISTPFFWNQAGAGGVIKELWYDIIELGDARKIVSKRTLWPRFGNWASPWRCGRELRSGCELLREKICASEYHSQVSELVISNPDALIDRALIALIRKESPSVLVSVMEDGIKTYSANVENTFSNAVLFFIRNVWTKLVRLPLDVACWPYSYFIQNFKWHRVYVTMPDKLPIAWGNAQAIGIESAFLLQTKEEERAYLEGKAWRLDTKYTFLLSRPDALDYGFDQEIENEFYAKVVRWMLINIDSVVIIKPHPRDSSNKVEFLEKLCSDRVYFERHAHIPAEILIAYDSCDGCVANWSSTLVYARYFKKKKVFGLLPAFIDHLRLNGVGVDTLVRDAGAVKVLAESVCWLTLDEINQGVEY